MEFFVYSRPAIASLPPHDVAHVIISITTTEGDRARFPVPPSCRGVLRVVFADIESPIPDVRMFDIELAREIWRFVLKHREAIARIVVHCDAGHSRSPAVAAALSRVLVGSDEEFFRRYEPNPHVYRLLLETHAEFQFEP
jgi:predicted protein tyrosine phosphatase